MSKNIKRLIISVVLLGIVGAGISLYLYQLILTPNVLAGSDKVIYIPTNSTFDDAITVLDTANILASIGSFRKVAKWMSYDEKINPGKYTIKTGWNNRELVNLLRSGNQTPVNLVINNVRTINDLAGKIASQVEVDSSTLANYLKDPSFLNKFDLDAEDAMTLFIPNTYQVYWTVSPDALSERLSQEKIKFWESNDRVRKATDLNLTPAQVYTLASIVERETQAGKERPTVAGLYLNRLKQGIPLQADPTVVFATGIYDLRRVLNVHLEIDSPYNTYKYAGLPPGPIFMPSIQSIDAVLDAEKHDYLYMCARPDNSGLHAFAASLSAHNQNANRYRQWLNDRGIK